MRARKELLLTHSPSCHPFFFFFGSFLNYTFVAGGTNILLHGSTEIAGGQGGGRERFDWRRLHIEISS